MGDEGVNRFRTRMLIPAIIGLGTALGGIALSEVVERTAGRMWAATVAVLTAWVCYLWLRWWLILQFGCVDDASRFDRIYLKALWWILLVITVAVAGGAVACFIMVRQMV